ncbi:hypothetical protein JTB14_003593 [Gonioctena quinquepunctata]|nr:hypothetical protein JTB14_003593 [Gonioctena quinquepunctata]
MILSEKEKQNGRFQRRRTEFQDSGSEYIPSDEEHETTIDNPTNAVPGPSHLQDFLSLKEKIKLSRKRLRHHSEWKRVTAKRAKAGGQEYLNVVGQVVPAKKFYDGDCTCHKKCHSLFTLEERKLIFDIFYKLKNFDLQTAFIFGKIQVEPKLRTCSRRALTDLPRRQNTRIYLLSKAGVNVVVYKTLKKSLVVLDGRISRTVRYKNAGNPTETTAPLDKRGKQTSEETVNGVISFIEKFPTYRSHYRRTNSQNAQYLSPDLCIAKMYSLYK